MITNKFLIMNTCNKCATEGLLSKCCETELTFTSTGAAKCSNCKRFTKMIPCDECKEDSVQITPINVYEEEKHNTYEERMDLRYGTVLALISILAVLGCVIYGLFTK